MKRDSLAEAKQRAADALPWAGTDVQRRYCETVARVGPKAAAKELGVGERRVREVVSRVLARAAAGGYAPDAGLDRKVPEGFAIHGLSEMEHVVDEDGNKRLRWTKMDRRQEDRLQALRDSVEQISESCRGALAPTPKPRGATDGERLTVYLMGDPHIGMLAHEEETGANWDLKISQSVTVGALQELIESTPESERALLVNAGDFFHADNRLNRTNKSGHALDVDSRRYKVVTAGVDLMVSAARRVLAKHANLKIINLEGNHDEDSAFWLSTSMRYAFESEPRIDVDMSPAIFRVHQFGQSLLGFCHGHTGKPAQYPLYLASHHRELWGSTKYHRIYHGHIHHERCHEYAGAVVEALNTVAPKDAWHASELYESARTMRAHVWHRERGLRGVHIVDARDAA